MQEANSNGIVEDQAGKKKEKKKGKGALTLEACQGNDAAMSAPLLPCRISY